MWIYITKYGAIPIIFIWLWMNVRCSTDRRQSCPDHWTHNQYSRACYHVVSQRVNWTVANDTCSTYSHYDNLAHLLVYDDKREAHFVDVMMFYNFEVQWIGGTISDGVLIWQPSSSSHDEDEVYENWLQPNTDPSPDLECVSITKNLYQVGTYYTQHFMQTTNCSLMQHYICEVEAFQCPPLPSIPHTSHDNNNLGLGNEVTFTCHQGHEYSDRSTALTLTCLHNTAVWQPAESPGCQVIHCSNITDLYPHSSANTTLTSYLTYLEISCDAGYEFPGGDTGVVIYCTADKSWSHTPHQCQKVECPAVPDTIDHATLDNNHTQYGDVIKQTCDTGYMLPSNHHVVIDVQCRANKTWSMTFDACVPVQCPHQAADNIQTSDARRTYQTTAVYTCITGHRFTAHDNDTEKHVYCGSDAQWNYTVPPCEPVECPALPVYFDPHGNLTDNLYSTEVRLECQSGAETTSAETFQMTVCDHKGHWVPPPLECSKKMNISELRSLPPSEAPGAQVIGSSSIFIVLIFLAAILILDLTTLAKHIKRMRRNLNDIEYQLEKFLGPPEMTLTQKHRVETRDFLYQMN